MFEEFRSFADYIKLYELQRAEGVLLRHLNSVFKVLAQTVPDTAKNDQVREMELYLGTMIRQVDSSLLDEWEKMRDPNYQRAETKEVRPPGAEEAAADITRDVKAFTAAIRNRIFTFLRGLVMEDYEAAIANLDFTIGCRRRSLGRPTDWIKPWKLTTPTTSGICLDPNARNARHTYVTPSEDKKSWRVQQMLVDPDGAQRLGGRIRRGPGRVAQIGRTIFALASAWQPVLKGRDWDRRFLSKRPDTSRGMIALAAQAVWLAVLGKILDKSIILTTRPRIALM